MYRTFFIVFSSAALLISCKGSFTSNNNITSASLPEKSTEELAPVDYVNWCRNTENNLKKEKEIGDITFSLLYKPAEYVACQEEQTTDLSSDTLREKLKELEGLDYYDLKIEITSGQGELLKYNVESAQQYSQRVSYFAFDMQKDIKLIEGHDTLDCQLFHFERAYDVAPYAMFLLGFPKSKISTSERTFFYQDKVFNKGIIKFTYTPTEIAQIPRLKTI